MSERAYYVECDPPQEPDTWKMDFRIRETNSVVKNVAFEGWVKWDGCIDWRATSPHYDHFCTHADAEDLLEAFAEVRRKAAELMKSYEGCIPDENPLPTKQG